MFVIKLKAVLAWKCYFVKQTLWRPAIEPSWTRISWKRAFLQQAYAMFSHAELGVLAEWVPVFSLVAAAVHLVWSLKQSSKSCILIFNKKNNHIKSQREIRSAVSELRNINNEVFSIGRSRNGWPHIMETTATRSWKTKTGVSNGSRYSFTVDMVVACVWLIC